MKPLTGGLIGALVTALAVFGWNGRPAARDDGGWTGVTVPPAGSAPRVGRRAAGVRVAVARAFGMRRSRSPASRVSARCSARSRARAGLSPRPDA